MLQLLLKVPKDKGGWEGVEEEKRVGTNGFFSFFLSRKLWFLALLAQKHII